MLITNYYYERPITYDEEKYSYEIINKTTGIIRFFDKKNDTTICCVLLPNLIKQIKEDEFIVIYPKEMENYFLFQHIKYDNSTKKTNIIFEKEFKSKSSIIGSVMELEEIFIIETWLETTIYNSKTKRTLTLEDSEITKLTNEYQTTHLKGRINIDEKDILTMYIDKNTLEFDGFYSQEQERMIPIIKESQDFSMNYSITLEKEIIKYLELLELYQEEYQKERDKKAEQVLSIHLAKKKTNKRQSKQ